MSLASVLVRSAQSGIRCLAAPVNCSRLHKKQFLVNARTLATISEEAFSKHEVVPDVIDSAPSKVVQVVYEGGLKASLGNVLTPTQVKKPPLLQWDMEADALYTVLLTDPDAPSREEPWFREWHQWLVVNVPGNDIASGDTIAQYVGSGPPPETGLHRYVFLVFKQSGRIEDKEHGVLTNTSGENRECFKTRAFIAKHNLGKPVAGNFYQAKYDNYVITLCNQLNSGLRA